MHADFRVRILGTLLVMNGRAPGEPPETGEKLSQFRAAGANKECIMSVNGIEITEIRVHPVKKKDAGSHLEAFVRVVLNGQLCINSIRVMRGKYGPFVSYPREYNRKEEKGYQFFYPITKPLQAYLSERILGEWKTVAA